jgi:hypothetical protein
MNLGERPTGDMSGDGQSMWRHVTWVGLSSGGEHGRHLPLAVSAESAQPSDAAPSAVAETEVEGLKRYLEVS